MASQPPYYNTWAVPGPPPPPPPPHPAQQQPQGQPQPYSPYQPHQQYSPGYVPEPLPPQASPTGQTQYSTDPHCYSTNPPSSYQAHAAPVYGTASLPPPPPHQYHQQPHGQRNVYPPPPGPPRGPPVSTAASTLPHTGQSQQSNGGNAAQRPYFPPPPGPPPAQADAPVFSIPASGTPSSTGSRPAPPPPPLAHQRDAVPRTSPAASQQAAPAPPHRAASENSASALHGLVEDMANQLRRLEVQAGSAQPPSVSASPAIRPSQTEVRELSDEDFEFPLVSYSPPRASGPPNQVLQECPDSRGVSSQVVWYELPDARGALVCSHCYARHVANTSLVGSFERLEASGGTCRFNTARILLHLWPEAQRTRSTSALARFLTRRRQIPDCKGWTGVKRDEDIKFFSPVATPPTGFVACEACYEDHVAASAFASRFGPTTYVQGPEDVWRCGFAGASVSRALRKYSKEESLQRGRGWERWAAEADHRINLPLCDWQAVDATSRRWFGVRGRGDVVVCEGCFLDRAGGTRFADRFEPLNLPLPAGAQAVCAFHCVPVLAAWGMALNTRDYSVFWRAAHAFADLGGGRACRASGTAGGTYYFLRGSTADFALCATCHAGLVVPTRADIFFEARRYGPETMFACDLAVDGARAGAYLGRLADALDTGVWAPFADFVARVSAAPLCPRDQLSAGVFYGFSRGFPDVAACAQCYEEVVRPSRFEGSVMHRGESQTAEGQPLKGICSFYSPRMRALWREACASGDLDGFLTAATDRVRVWCETVPVRDTLLARQKMLQQQAMTQALAGVAFQGMENVTMASSAQSGTGMLFGGGTLGWHPTMYGAEAAQANQAMLGGFAQALDGNVWTTMAALEERWKAVA